MSDAPHQPQQWLGRLQTVSGGTKLIGWIEDYAGWRIKLDCKLDSDGTYSVFGELLEREPIR